jgi:hypothetical protein
LLLEELTQRGVEVLFLNRPLGHTPEDQLLLQVQRHCGIRAGQISRTEPPRQAARCASGARRGPVPCALRLPVCEQAGRRR